MTTQTTTSTHELCPGCDQAWGIYWTGSTPTTDSWACRDCGTEWTITVHTPWTTSTVHYVANTGEVA